MAAGWCLAVAAELTSGDRLPSSAEPASAPAVARPNIVLIVADDLGYNDLASYGQTLFPTPATDQLAKQGRRLTHAYAPSAVCSPTRYAILTGTDPFRRYHTTHVLFNGEPLVIDANEPTIASLLQAQDYRTAVVGKWHLGLGDALPRDLNVPGRGPNQVGFDSSFIVPDGHNMLPAYYLRNGKVVGGTTVPFRFRPTVVEREGYSLLQHVPIGSWENRRPNDRIAETLVAEAVDFITENKDRPFFLYLPTCSIHFPAEPARQFVGRSGIGVHGDFVMEFDWMVGQVTAALSRLQLSDHTLLIVTSDNGGYESGRESLMRTAHDPNRPWRGHKETAFEGGHRVPFLARWPGKIAPGTVGEELLSLTDMTATLCAVAGVSIPADAARDSIDASAALWGQVSASGVRNQVITCTRGMKELAIRDRDWKLILQTESGRSQLYHLAVDPTESVEVGNAQPAQVQRLTRLLHENLAAGASRFGAQGRPATLAALLGERETRNQLLRERFSVPRSGGSKSVTVP